MFDSVPNLKSENVNVLVSSSNQLKIENWNSGKVGERNDELQSFNLNKFGPFYLKSLENDDFRSLC